LTTRATRTVGLDNSKPLLARARADAPDGVTFFHHDVTDLPFPRRPAGLVYARLVLSHVPRTELLMRAWMGELGPGGVLALDEVESISTDNAALRRYLKLLGALVSVRGSSVAAGPIVDRFDGGPDGRKRTSMVRAHPVPAAVAAELFALNLVTWREEPFVRDNYSRTELDDLDAELRHMAGGRSGHDMVIWVMR
jgi:SAM-dependent methyltransferase